MISRLAIICNMFLISLIFIFYTILIQSIQRELMTIRNTAEVHLDKHQNAMEKRIVYKNIDKSKF